MAKFVLLFVAAVAFHAVVADHQQQRRQVNDMVTLMKQRTVDYGNLLQPFSVEDSQARRFLTYQANDFAHCIQNVVYEMQYTAQNTQGETQKKIMEIAGKLGEHAFAIRQAMNAEPNQMKVQLKTQVLNVVEEAEKMKQFIDQLSEEDKRMVRDEMKQAISDIWATVKRVYIQMQMHKKSHDEINDQVQTLIGQMPMYVENIKTADEQTAKDMIHQGQQFAHFLNAMIEKLEREADKQEGEVKESMRQLCKQMIETHAIVEKAVNVQGDYQAQISEMKNVLPRTMQTMGSEVRAMMQLTKSSQDNHVKQLMKCTMSDAMAAAENMKAQLEVIAKNNKN